MGMSIDRIAEIEVVRDETDTTRTVWRFRFHPHSWRFVVDYYATEERASRRHKWRAAAARRYSRDEPRSYFSGIDWSDVPLSEDVIEEVRGEFAKLAATVPVRRAPSGDA